MVYNKDPQGTLRRPLLTPDSFTTGWLCGPRGSNMAMSLPNTSPCTEHPLQSQLTLISTTTPSFPRTWLHVIGWGILEAKTCICRIQGLFLVINVKKYPFCSFFPEALKSSSCTWKMQIFLSSWLPSIVNPSAEGWKGRVPTSTEEGRLSTALYFFSITKSPLCHLFTLTVPTRCAFVERWQVKDTVSSLQHQSRKLGGWRKCEGGSEEGGPRTRLWSCHKILYFLDSELKMRLNFAIFKSKKT